MDVSLLLTSSPPVSSARETEGSGDYGPLWEVPQRASLARALGAGGGVKEKMASRKIAVVFINQQPQWKYLW